MLARERALAPLGVEGGRGFFVHPTLLSAPLAAAAANEHEVFGPVPTLLEYGGGAEEAAAVVRRARGGLVASIYSDDLAFVREIAQELAPYHGRLFLGSGRIAE